MSFCLLFPALMSVKNYIVGGCPAPDLKPMLASAFLWTWISHEAVTDDKNNNHYIGF